MPVGDTFHTSNLSYRMTAASSLVQPPMPNIVFCGEVLSDSVSTNEFFALAVTFVTALLARSIVKYWPLSA